MVLQGGEVAERPLRTNVPKAKCLTLLYEDDDLVGVAALKVLQESYRTTLSTKSGVSVSKAAFPYELGYIFVAPEARGNRYSERLVASALKAAGSRSIFATSRSDNIAIHKTLNRNGFDLAGKAYMSKDGKRKLQLFCRAAGPQQRIMRAPNDGRSTKQNRMQEGYAINRRTRRRCLTFRTTPRQCPLLVIAAFAGQHG
jgi:GNAT superfamily N-acetyltransferase